MAIKVANNNSLSAITSLPAAVSGGAMTLISTQTASDTGTISFTSGIDSTYKEYIFVFNNIHPASNLQGFLFNGSTDGGSNYNVTKTTTLFRNRHKEDGSSGEQTYDTSRDMAQGTGDLNILLNIGNGNDECFSGSLILLFKLSNSLKNNFGSCSSGGIHMVPTISNFNDKQFL